MADKVTWSWQMRPVTPLERECTKESIRLGEIELPGGVPESEVSLAITRSVKPVCDQCLHCESVLVNVAKAPGTGTEGQHPQRTAFMIRIRPGVSPDPPE
ncbi:MAG: hypothetical protein IIC82_08270 [Chloroflexi bacterium]|nr:hypothetical protein [Chloroflexota bacterium]